MEIKEYVKMRKNFLNETINNLEEKPHLLIIQVNEDEASNAYVKGKIKDLSLIGAKCTHLKLSLDITENELLNVIKMNNYNDDVDGILVQMPLPKHINETKVKETIAPIKDVDGFHPLSKCIACTPKGIIDYLKNENVEFEGKNAVVIGRSNIVGKPVAQLLLGLNCNVTILHSRTKKEDMNFYLAHADIVVVAVGKKHFLCDQPLKETAVIVDVGINRVDGKLYGDCAPNLNVSLQTPVPGGVGLLTRCAMLENLLICYNNRRGLK
ncbi:MAG: bifunctional 5,10-methylenetetrahydrofolate dehydrogenase/5,10-methenyltetrahydrofolate cyclohydrolase [Erysipelotrichaceae bacterium]|nr:bifunctional 5,10-methylenetetrahydrofolate dehydrogenase/5,10-methenyltetrahydrofolate cyclohydrolase [Erysipelotrichaceae bacterium]